MTAHLFPIYTYHDQIWCMQRYLKKPPDMKVRSFTTRPIQLNTYLSYFPPDRPGQLVTYLPDDDIQKILYHAMPNIWGKEKGRTGIQLLRWFYLFYGKILRDKDWRFRIINSTKWSLKKQQEKKERSQEKESSNFQRFWGWRFRSRTFRKKVLPVPLHMLTYHGSMYHSQHWSSKQNRKRASILTGSPSMK